MHAIGRGSVEHLQPARIGLHHVGSTHPLTQPAVQRLEQLGSARYLVEQRRLGQFHPHACVARHLPAHWHMVFVLRRDDVRHKARAKRTPLAHSRRTRCHDHALLAVTARVLDDPVLAHDETSRPQFELFADFVADRAQHPPTALAVALCLVELVAHLLARQRRVKPLAPWTPPRCWLDVDGCLVLSCCELACHLGLHRRGVFVLLGQGRQLQQQLFRRGPLRAPSHASPGLLAQPLGHSLVVLGEQLECLHQQLDTLYSPTRFETFLRLGHDAFDGQRRQGSTHRSASLRHLHALVTSSGVAVCLPYPATHHLLESDSLEQEQ